MAAPHSAPTTIEHALPPNGGVGIPAPASPGEWQGLDGFGSLNQVAEGLRRPEIAGNLEDLVSVPHVWAQVEIFRMALVDEDHPLHMRAVKEWRGLLALFALKPFDLFTLETSVIEVASDDESDVQPEFMSVLQRTTPSEMLVRDLDWDRIAAIRVEGALVGLMVPSTVVAPTRSYQGTVPPTVRWLDGGRLGDPSEQPGVQVAQLLVLQHYLANLADEWERTHIAQGTDSLRLGGAVRRELSAYRAGVDARLRRERDREHWDGKRPVFIAAPGALEVPPHAIYRSLLRQFIVPTQIESDTLLDTRSDFQDLVKGAVLYDQRMHGPHGRPEDIRIWGYCDLAQLMDGARDWAAVEQMIESEGYVPLVPEKIFTPRLTRLDRPCHGHGETLSHYLLPIDPALMLFLTPDDLRGQLRITSTDPYVTVSLTLDLRSTRTGCTETYTLSKAYEPKEIDQLETPTTLGVWPDFESDSWPYYFVCYGGNVDAQLSLRFPFSSDTVRHAIERDGPIENVREVKRLAESEATRLNQLVVSDEREARVELYHLQRPPEAIACMNARVSAANGASPDPAYAGLLLFDRLRRVNSVSDKWNVGIDFGTTNTTVYFSTAGTSPAPLRFDRHFVEPHQLRDGANAILGEAFIPLDPTEVPFLSLLRDRNLEGPPRKTPLWDGYINYVVAVVQTLRRLRSAPLRFDLKWSSDPDDRERIEIFLAQVVVQVLAEAAALGIQSENISWNFSYPEAFTGSQLGWYKQTYPSALQVAADPSRNMPRPGNPRTRSESLATALYFETKHGKSFGQTAITIDIGGRTSDVTIWQNRSLIWQSSLKFAGQHIFIEYLSKHSEFIKELAGREAHQPKQSGDSASPRSDLSSIYRELQQLDADAFRYGLEVVVNSHGYRKAMENHLHQIAEIQVARGLQYVAEFSLGGLLFYLAQTVCYLRSKGVLQDTHPPIWICLGGRSSAVFERLIGDQADHIARMFKDVSGWSHDVKAFTYSENPKHEVAYGLLVDPEQQGNLGVDRWHRDSILGEVMEANGNTVESDFALSQLDLDQRWQLKSTSKLDEFIEIHNRYLGREISLDERRHELLGNVERGLTRALADARENRVPDNQAEVNQVVLMEPPFIIALREAVRLIAAGE